MPLALFCWLAKPLEVLIVAIYRRVGSVGSGKSYMALEEIVDKLHAGKNVIANFPLIFTPRQIKQGLHLRFMYVPSELFYQPLFITTLKKISIQGLGPVSPFYGIEGQTLLVIDECGDLFPPEANGKPLTKAWKDDFFRWSRKFGFDVCLIHQSDDQVCRVVRDMCEYIYDHRNAMNINPFKFFGKVVDFISFGRWKFTIFFSVVFWKNRRNRIGTFSTTYMNRLGRMYDTHNLFGQAEELEKHVLPVGFSGVPLSFGNCDPNFISEVDTNESTAI